VDAASGDEQWRFQTGDYVDSSPTVVDGIVYVASDDGNLYAVDADVSGSSEGSRVRLGTLGHHHTWANKQSGENRENNNEGSSSSSAEAFYNFEGTGATLIDRSGNDHTGELVTADRVSGRDGTVLEFDRTNQEYAKLGEAETLNPRTGSYSVSLWFRTDSGEGANHNGRDDIRYLFSKRGGSNERFVLKLVDQTPGASVRVDDALVFQIKDDGGLGNDSVTANQSLANGEWHHVLAVRDTDNEEIRLYLNGELVGTAPDNQADINPTGPAYLGGEPERFHPDHYTGQIDDVKIWKAAVEPGDGDESQESFDPAVHGFNFTNWAGESGC
jgi:hypothetical protein